MLSSLSYVMILPPSPLKCLLSWAVIVCGHVRTNRKATSISQRLPQASFSVQSVRAAGAGPDSGRLMTLMTLKVFGLGISHSS